MRLFTAEQAAEYLGVTANRVRQFCRAGRLGTKSGRDWVITEDELEAFAKLPRPAGKPPAEEVGE